MDHKGGQSHNLKEDTVYMPSPPVDVQAFERTLKTYDAERLKKGALQGTIGKFGSRVFCWRIFLGVLSAGGNPKIWAEELSKQRAEYYERYEEFRLTTKNFDPNKFNPLMAAGGGGENPYNFLFKDADLKNTIRQDIERTYQEAEFFRQSYVKDQMMSILFLWSRHNQDISYRQGMNEILGTIFFLFHSQKLKNKIDDPTTAAESAENLLAYMNNEKYLVPDMFVVFDLIMQMGIKELFLPYQQNHKADLESHDKVKSLRKTEELFYFNFDRPSTLQIINDKVARDLSPLMKRCNRIYNFYLKLIDKQLYDHLLRQKIEPQIHLTRWLRCMLNRQFHIEDVLKFWDAIFSLIMSATKFTKKKDIYAADDYYDKDQSDPLVFLDVICVTMISYVRSYLLEQDTTGCLQRLMKYPPLEDPQLLIKRALQFRRYLFRKEKFPDVVNTTKDEPQEPKAKQESPLTDPLFKDAPVPYKQKAGAAKTQLFEEEEPPPPEKKEPQTKKKTTSHFGLLNPLAALAQGATENQPFPKSARGEKKKQLINDNIVETSYSRQPEKSAAPPRFTNVKEKVPPRFNVDQSGSNVLPRFQAPVYSKSASEEEPAAVVKPTEHKEEMTDPLKPKKAFGLLKFEAAPSSTGGGSNSFQTLQEEESRTGKQKKKGKEEEGRKKPMMDEEPRNVLSMTQSFLGKGKKEREMIDFCRLVRTVIRKTKDSEPFDPIHFSKALQAVDKLEDFVRDSFKEAS